MVDAQKTPHPAVTHVRNLVSHFEELGHRDVPVVLSAHEYLTSLEPKPEVKPPAPNPPVSHK